MIYPNWFIFSLAILLGYLSVVDWVYLSISFFDLSLVVFFDIFAIIVLFLTKQNFLWEEISLKLLFLSLIFVFYVFLIRTKKMGAGDFWVFLLISILLPFHMIWESLYISVLVGGIYSFVLVLINKKNLKKQIPFIPFMTIGFLLAIMITKA